MRILLLGSNGQVGSYLAACLKPLGDVVSTDRLQIDLADAHSIEAGIDKAAPDLIVNAAAYTAVDQAEKESELAFAVNGSAPGVIARRARRHNALVMHYSTDYVFDGEKSEPYVESDPVSPLSVYGSSKLAGETAMRDEKGRGIILRTTWVYAPRGKNFVKTILRLAAERDELRIVADQFGAPTAASDLADATVLLAQRASARIANGTFQSGLYHLTAAGRTSWHGFALRIVAQWRQQHGQDALRAKLISPISSVEFPTPAVRPKNSSLSNQMIQKDYGIELPQWQDSLDVCLAALASDLSLVAPAR